jgi:MFS family permease
VLGAIASWLFIPESPVRSPAKIDLRGAAVFAVGIILPLVGISQAHTWGWQSSRTLGLIAAGLLVLAGWVLLERRTDQPLADVTLLARPAVLATNVATMLMGFGMFAGYVLVPQLSQTPTSTGYGLGLDPTETGLVLLPGALIMLVAGPLSGKLATRFAPKVPFAIGGMVAAVGLLLLGFEHSSAGWIVVLNLFNGFGVGMAFAAMPNLIVRAVPLERTGEATGFNALVRSVGMSIGSQLAASILASHALAGGYSSERGFEIAFVLGAVMCCIAGFAVMLVPSTRPAARSELAVAERRAA